ncbi:MAG: hypothetical protein MN733_02415 [Nitrososphaera sp.]|nr:hypothetical protein [Nitrososphaera sp.]
MAKQYRTREGTTTTVDAKLQLASLGSESAPGPLLVPAKAKMLKAAHVVFGPDLSVAADGTYIVRLEGPGLPEGPEVLTIGASGVPVATGGVMTIKATRIELDIPVVPSNEILIFAENAGEDTGSVAVGVTLEFQM